MAEIEVDYLVVGAGASGMAFVDALVVDDPEAEVLLVDRRHRPGGHWHDAYPFVRLHQPSATYGVNSTRLGNDRVDDFGPNAGFYERATSAEIVAYFDDVLETVLAPKGVQYRGMVDYCGDMADEHTVVSRLDGEETTVRVRRKLVDATYTQSSVPSRHTPGFAIGDGAIVIPPNDLVHLESPAAGYTVMGAGKTALDTCVWLLESGVDPDDIRWVRSRDGWFFNRAFTQPLEQVGSYMQLQASFVGAAAAAEDADDFARRLEADEVFVRLDPEVPTRAFRGATVSMGEVAALRSIENVVRQGRIRRVDADRITFVDGELPTAPGHVHVDCTAAGVRPTTVRPVFEPGRITIQYVTLGFVPWGAATIGATEALKDDDATKNRLCPPVIFTGDVADILSFADAGMQGLAARSMDREISAWTDASRLNPGRGANVHLDDARVTDALTSIGSNLFPALENLSRLTASN